LQYNQQQVYDSITKRFIAVFMTIVWLPYGSRKAADILFKTTEKKS
jgi:DNA topoisomerase-3